jgi:predicted DNA-binding transcriptional regulator YafY
MTAATNPVNDFQSASQKMIAQQAAMNTAQLAHQTQVTTLTAVAATQTENARVTRELISQAARP